MDKLNSKQLRVAWGEEKDNKAEVYLKWKK